MLHVRPTFVPATATLGEFKQHRYCLCLKTGQRQRGRDPAARIGAVYPDVICQECEYVCSVSSHILGVDGGSL